MTDTLLTYPAMQEFTCLGDHCEDTCCQSWDIRFDRYHYALLQDSVQADARLKTLFKKHIKRIDDGDDKNYAIVQLNNKGFCPFLDKKGWCELHTAFGIAPLSNICAFYPRVISAFNGQYEIAGALSCPEMARKTLLTDKAFAFSEMSRQDLPRPEDFPVVRSINVAEDDYYAAPFLTVRKSFLQLAAEERFSFETRLFGLSSLANSISAFYYQGCQQFNPQQLDKELDRYLTEQNLSNLQSYIDQYSPDSPLAMIVVQAVLRMRLQQFPDDSLSRLINVIFEDYQQDMGEAPELYGGNLPPEQLWHAYQQRAISLSERFPILMDQLFTRYLENCLFREWYITMPNPFVYMHMLNIRIAMLRFLLISHPEVAALLQSDTIESDQEQAFQAHAIDVFYRFSRAIDHNMNFLQVVFNAIAEQEMMHFDFALPFIKF